MFVHRAGRLLCFLLFACSAALSADASQERIILPTNVIPTHYDIAIVPDSAELTFTGSVTIDLDIVESTPSITLNVADLALSRVQLAGQTEQPEISFDENNQTATFKFTNPIEAGHHQLSIDYTGKIFEQASGLFALDYSRGKVKKRAVEVAKGQIALNIAVRTKRLNDTDRWLKDNRH